MSELLEVSWVWGSGSIVLEKSWRVIGVRVGGAVRDQSWIGRVRMFYHNMTLLNYC